MSGHLILSAAIYAVLPLLHCCDPLLCTTDNRPLSYKLPPVNPCDTEKLMNKTITIYHTRPVHQDIQGWRITLLDVSCTTHYFFWGSYTHNLRTEKPEDVMFPDMTMGATCPGASISYTNQEDLVDQLCKYSWPGETTTTRRVCYMDKAELMSFGSTLTVDGHPVSKCSGNLCGLSHNAVFFHTSGKTPGVEEEAVYYTGPASCDDRLCMVPALGEAYPVLTPIIAGPNGTMRYKSVSGSTVAVDPRSIPEVGPQQGSPIGDGPLVAKIVGTEAAVRVLAEEVKRLCDRTRDLYQSIVSQASTSPMMAAALYLNRTDITAIYTGDHLLVWPCVTIRDWSWRHVNECTAYIPITYSGPTGNMSGYIDPRTQRTHSTSPSSSCGTHYIVQGDTLVEIHQRYGASSYVKTHPLSPASAGPKRAPIPVKLSSWAARTEAAATTRPREFSYHDLSNPVGGSGRTWLETEMYKVLPDVYQLAHLKMSALALFALLGVLVIAGLRYLINIGIRISRLEHKVIESLHLTP